MSAQKVDVLAVMDEACNALTSFGEVESAAAVELRLARATVEELIEAAEYMSSYFHKESEVTQVIQLRASLANIVGDA